jgi:DNA-binding NarL/FixJ family response regulator
MSEQTVTGMLNARIVEAPIRIALMSPARLIRESLAELLPRDRRLLIVGVFEDPWRALPQLEDLDAHLALIDATFLSARAAVSALHDAFRHVPIVVFSITETLEEVVAWAEAGAAGYVPKMVGLADMTELLVEIMNGEHASSAKVAESPFGSVMKPRGPNDGDVRNTPQLLFTVRETEIIKLIDQGMSNKEIARHLDIGVATTKTHIHHILGKLNVKRRGQAIHWYRYQDTRIR